MLTISPYFLTLIFYFSFSSLAAV